MAKGPYLTARVKELIARIYLDDLQIKPSEARESLLKRMKAEGLNQTFGSAFPGISTVSKELKLLREKDQVRSPESKGLDEPWSILTLHDYPIPPEALPKVLKEFMSYESGLLNHLTIRQAMWVARLSAVKDPEDLPCFYCIIAAAERLFELTDTPLKSRIGTFIEEVLASSLAGDSEGEKLYLNRCLTWYAAKHSDWFAAKQRAVYDRRADPPDGPPKGSEEGGQEK